MHRKTNSMWLAGIYFTFKTKKNFFYAKYTYSSALMDTVLLVTEFGNHGSATCMRTLARPKRAGTKAEAIVITASNTTNLANIIFMHPTKAIFAEIIFRSRISFVSHSFWS